MGGKIVLSKQLLINVSGGVLIAGICGVFIAGFAMSDDIAAVQTEQAVAKTREEATLKAMEAMTGRQTVMTSDQQEIRVSIGKLETHNEHVREALDDIKELLRK